VQNTERLNTPNLSATIFGRIRPIVLAANNTEIFMDIELYSLIGAKWAYHIKRCVRAKAMLYGVEL
jgi:hypothetical protein